MTAATLNWIEDYRTITPDGGPTIRVLCSACTPTHEDVEIVHDEVWEAGEECEACSRPGICPVNDTAITFCGCATCSVPTWVGGARGTLPNFNTDSSRPQTTYPGPRLPRHAPSGPWTMLNWART